MSWVPTQYLIRPQMVSKDTFHNTCSKEPGEGRLEMCSLGFFSGILPSLSYCGLLEVCPHTRMFEGLSPNSTEQQSLDYEQ